MEEQKKPSRNPKGRPKKTDEERTMKLARAALTKKYGSEDAALLALVSSGEPTLIRFVFEHAFGRPVEKRDLRGKDGKALHTYVDIGGVPSEQMVKLPDNFEGDDKKVIDINRANTQRNAADQGGTPLDTGTDGSLPQ